MQSSAARHTLLTGILVPKSQPEFIRHATAVLISYVFNYLFYEGTESLLFLHVLSCTTVIITGQALKTQRLTLM